MVTAESKTPGSLLSRVTFGAGTSLALIRSTDLWWRNIHRAREQLSFAVSLGIAKAPEQLMLHDEIEDQEV